MSLRIICLAGCLFATLLGDANIFAEQLQRSSSPIWITLRHSPANGHQESSVEIQVPSGIDFKVIDAIAETLSDQKIDVGRLVAHQDISLEFSSASFVVMRIDGTDLTLAPGSGFPFETTRALTTALNQLGVKNTTIVDPDKLLHRRFSQGDPFFPEYAYSLRAPSASQSRN
ncbi:hypothetical protein FYK55_26210 [Roseiconus nitratireducens]|uniref:Beta-hexosaminidase bacterial type N-terminal domain-containing protein n=2 Tax=Roseiconus nitratireducens TaxID=2605748 RepID=A0A5M6CV49_9BACT|nr:hypothetical protein FYK55_26210 [Roseiconus nitratireducens]